MVCSGTGSTNQGDNHCVYIIDCTMNGEKHERIVSRFTWDRIFFHHLFLVMKLNNNKFELDWRLFCSYTQCFFLH